MKLLHKVLVIFTLLVSITLVAADNVPSTGSRSTLLGIYGTQEWNLLGGGFKLNWSITQTNDVFHYVYSISDVLGGDLGKNMTGFYLEVGPTLTLADIFNV